MKLQRIMVRMSKKPKKASKKKSAAWLAFEKDVHRMNQALRPDKEVLHDQRVPDKDSGNPRQIDVTVKDKLTGSLDDAIECRARSSPQGAPWIEDSQGRKRSLQAREMTLVSKSGFYEPAQVKADALTAEGTTINLRHCEDLTGLTAQLFHPSPIHLKFLELHEMKCKLHTVPSRALPEDFCAEKFRFVDKATGVKLSTQGMLENHFSEKLDSLPVNSRFPLDVNLVDEAASSLLAPVGDEQWELSKVEFSLICTYHDVEIPMPARLRLYRDNATRTPLSAIARYEFVFHGREFFFEMLYTPQRVAEFQISKFDRSFSVNFSPVSWDVLEKG